MAVIEFYETNPIDTFQLTEKLRSTDHYWHYNHDVITRDNVNTNAEVVSIFTNSTLTKEIMDLMPRLKLIALRSTGYDNVDLDHAHMRNIVVVNVPSYGANTVAEHAFGLLLSLTRRLVSTVDDTKNGTYQVQNNTGTDIGGKTIGIVGLGVIGRNMARIAKGFGMNVLAHDRQPDEENAKEIGYTHVSFDDLLTQSDIVSLHVPLNPDSYYMFNMGTIERMKRGAILINTSRGEIVENRALIEALNSGHLAGAGLDAVEGEQFLQTNSIIKNLVTKAASPESYLHTAEISALLRMPNVVITPHSAFNTTQAIERINTTTAKNIIDFWFGLSPNQVKAPKSSGKLVIIRHGQSEWNALGKWTGTTDVHVTKLGVLESAKIGEKIKDIPFDYAYISQQIRTKETLEAIINGAEQLNLRYEATTSINERDYGIYTGMRKNDIQKIIGDAAYDELRRSWDSPVEGGESLKDVYERVVPFYLRIIMPRLRHGQNILVVAHGNSIRSLVKYIENISNSEIGDMEMIQGAALMYEVDREGRAKSKEVIQIDSKQDVPDNEP